MVNRREFFGLTLGAGAALTLTPELLRAVQQAAPSVSRGGTLMQRAIPSSGEMVPVISFGARTTDNGAIQARR